jgi:hypothetical protein
MNLAYNICYISVALEFVARILAGLGTGLRILNLLDASDDGAVEGEDTGSLEELRPSISSSCHSTSWMGAQERN